MPMRAVPREAVEEVGDERRRQAADALAPERQLDPGERRGRRGRPPRGRPPRRAARGRRRSGGCRCARRAPVERLPEHDGDVLDRVVLVHPQVARAVQVEVDQRVRGERGQHVVEHADAGRDRRAAGAVEARPGSGCRSRACAARPRPSAPAPRPARGRGSGRAERLEQAVVLGRRRHADADRRLEQRVGEGAHDQPLLEQLARDRLGRAAEVDEDEVRARRRHGVAGARAGASAIRSRSAQVAAARAAHLGDVSARARSRRAPPSGRRSRRAGARAFRRAAISAGAMM